MPRDILDITQPAATMLRQQQAEIEALKKDNKELHGIAQRMAMAESDARKSLQWIKDAKERQSEPVAWGFFNDGVIYDCVTNYDYCGENGIPLYTHPAKTLTDFEIMQISAGYPDRLYFAKAILRKAQEK